MKIEATITTVSTNPPRVTVRLTATGEERVFNYFQIAPPPGPWDANSPIGSGFLPRVGDAVIVDPNSSRPVSYPA